MISWIFSNFVIIFARKFHLLFKELGMRKIVALIAIALFSTLGSMAQGWPSGYGGVMLQGFFWDSFRPADGRPNQTMATMYGAGWGENDQWYIPVTTWTELLNQKDVIAPYIDLLWLPQSGATVCSDKSVFNTEDEAWRAGHNGSWVVTRRGDLINNPDCMGFVPVFYLDHGRGQTYTVNGTTWNPKSYFGTESELINLINAYKAAGTGAMEDVVANHKGGLSTWSGVDYAADFVDETNVTGPTTGKTYSIQWEWDQNGKCVDICSDDESGKGSGNTDCGGDAGKGSWARDVDHHSPSTQQKVMTYLRYLKDELGYIGFRYDYARGFEPKHFAYYNTTVRPTFSVGEFWGTFEDITAWIKGVYDEGGFQSAAFDFPLQEVIRQAFNDESGHSFRNLENDGLIWDYRYRRFAVTFIDNHDTFKDLPTDASNSNYQHRVNHQLVEANCFILTMPGTPCLFYPHFMHPDWHPIIAGFIKARRTAGITNESTVWPSEKIGNYGIAWRVTGEKGELYLQLGNEAVNTGVPSGFTQLWCNTAGTCRLSITSTLADQVDGNEKQNLVYGYPVVSKSSGNYAAPIEVNVKPSSEGTVLVYTTDGKMPGVYSDQITDMEGMDFSFTTTTTLKVGVLANGQVHPNSVVTRDYVVDNAASDGNIRVYVKYDGGNLPFLYAYDDNDNSLTGTFPGWQYSTANSVVIGGVTWLHATVPAERMNVILSYGGDATKTADIMGVTTDVFYTFADNVAHDVTSVYAQALYDPIVTIDLASGDYEGDISPRLTASNSNAVIVYTTDGSEPSASNGTQVTYQGVVSFTGTGSHVLRAGVLVDGRVINQEARTYYINQGGSQPQGVVNVYVSAESAPYIHAWSGNTDYTAWPGQRLTDKSYSHNGINWYKYSQQTSSLNVILNDGNGNQTVNIEGLLPGDHYIVYNGITGYTLVDENLPSCVYNLGDDVFYCYFENSAPYGLPYIWAYDQTSIYTGGSWPGEALIDAVGVAPNGNIIYRWTYTGGKTNPPASLLFSDNGGGVTGVSKTTDLTFVNGGYYNANGLAGVADSKLKTLADVIRDGVVGEQYVIADDLSSVWLNEQGEWLWVKDDNGDAVNPSYNTRDLPVPTAIQDVNYDQSNWAQLVLKDPLLTTTDVLAFSNKTLLGQTVLGRLIDKQNPTIELRANPIPAATASYVPNTFYPANFVNQENYFMIEPKPQEYVNITWAICRKVYSDGKTFEFVVPKRDGTTVNAEDLPGAFVAHVKEGYWENYDGYQAGMIQANREYYGVKAIVKAIDHQASHQRRLNLTPDDEIHSPVSTTREAYLISVGSSNDIHNVVDEVDGVARIVDVDYYNLMGMRADHPFDGINIVVTRYEDGTIATFKVIR